jgi:hypothetical protein
MTIKHTPAPWQLTFGDHGFAIHAGLTIVVMIDDTMDEWKANARLIAAAPELLDALESLSHLEIKGHALIDRLQFSDEGRALSDKITRAIAKAKGDA